MWGTIARMQIRPEVPEAYLRAQIDAFSTERVEGLVSSTFYRSDADPHELWIVVMFESKELYQRNSERPATHQAYLTLRSCLEEDVEWHDVDEVVRLGGKRPAP